MKKFYQLLLSPLIIFSSLFSQEISYNHEFKINDRRIISRPPRIEVEAISKNNFIACYSSYDSSSSGVYLQIFNSDSLKFGESYLVNTTEKGAQSLPMIETFSDSTFLVWWKDDQRSPISPRNGMYCQRFDEFGNKVNNEIHLRKNLAYYNDLTILSDQRMVFCYSGNVVVDGNTQWNTIVGEIYDENGQKFGNTFDLTPYNSMSSQKEFLPKITNLSDGGFVLCWLDFNEQNQIMLSCQFYDTDISLIGDPIIFSDTFSNRIWGDYCLVELDKERIIIIAGDKAKIINKQSHKVEKNIQFGDNPQNPDIAILENKKFIICWNSGPDGNQDIYCQIFNYDGTCFGPEFLVNSYKKFDQSFPRVTRFSQDKFVVIWIYSHYNWILPENAFGKYFYANPISHTLNSFNLKSPFTDEILNTISIPLEWQQSNSIPINLPWEMSYTLYFDEDEDFKSPTVIESIYDTTYTVQNLTPGTTYFWKVLAKNIAGDSLWSTETNAFFVDWDATALEQNTNYKIQKFKLQQNYPNPFNPNTTIGFELAQSSHVLLKIFNIQGREVAKLRDEDMLAGQHKVTFDAGDLASGVYFYSIQMGSYRETKKMLLLR